MSQPPNDPLEGVRSVADAPPATAALTEHPPEEPKKSDAPRRYPHIGVPLLLVFMAFSARLAMVQGESALGVLGAVLPGVAPHTSSAKLPPEALRVLSSLSDDCEELACLNTFDWDHPDSECRSAVLPVAFAFEKHLAALDGVGGSRPGPLHEITLATADLATFMKFVPSIEAAPGPAPGNIDPTLRKIGRQASHIVELIDKLAPDRDAPGSAASRGLSVMTGTAVDEVVKEPVAPPPPTQQPPVVQPAPAAVTPPAFVAGVPDAPPAPTPVAAVAVAPTVSDRGPVEDAVREALKALETCPRTAYEAPECVSRARASLATADRTLSTYRTAAGEPGAAFARQIDVAISKLRRATVEFLNAAHEVGAMDPGDAMAGNVFAHAESQLKEAQAAVKAAAP